MWHPSLAPLPEPRLSWSPPLGGLEAVMTSGTPAASRVKRRPAERGLSSYTTQPYTLQRH